MGKIASSQTLATRVVETLQHAGHVAYFAGGCVRDSLMGRQPADYDVATAARPEQVLQLFPKAQKVGAAFGVVLVREKNTAVEVATFRTEGVYSDGRRPDAVSFTDAQHDAARRDFTCNGLFYDPITQQIHDFVGGQADIQRKMLRAIGDPIRRFSEDHLRLLRAVRFAAKLHFDIESSTWTAIQQQAEHIQKISRERIGEELRMMLEHPTALRAIEMLDNSGLLECIWPDHYFGNGLLTRERVAWSRVARMSPQPRHVMLVAMSLDMTNGHPPLRSWTHAAGLLQQAFALANQERDDIAWLGDKLALLNNPDNWRRAVLKRLLADARFDALYTLLSATSAVPQDQAFSSLLAACRSEGAAVEPFVTGADLIGMGASPGPKFKAWLDLLYDRQLEMEFPSRDAALAAAKSLMANQ